MGRIREREMEERRREERRGEERRRDERRREKMKGGAEECTVCRPQQRPVQTCAVTMLAPMKAVTRHMGRAQITMLPRKPMMPREKPSICLH